MPSVTSSSHRLPLRERCNIALRVDTNRSYPKSRSLRKKTTKPSLDTVSRSKAESCSFVDKPQRNTALRENCIGEVIPGMFIAFHDDRDKAVKVSEGGKQFTHVISISSSNAPGRAVEYSSTYDDGSHIRALHLTIPHLATNPPSPRTNLSRVHRLSLSVSQLRIARDFLSLALPYTPDSTPMAWTTSCTRLLITTPLGRPVDALCTIAAYLSFTSGEDVCDVLNGIDEIEELESVWKRKVCEDDVGLIQMIAEEE